MNFVRLFQIIAVAGGMVSAMAAPVITSALGDEFYFGNPDATTENLRQFYRTVAGEGFTLTWGGNPPGWSTGLCEDAAHQAYLQECAAIMRENGIGTAFGFAPAVLLPYNESTGLRREWLGQVLNPESGVREYPESNCWNYGSAEALAEFRNRMEYFCNAMKPREMFFVDEQILIAPGPNAHEQRMSAYWSSPTYSPEALADFRRFLTERGFTGAAEARFPVTTVAVAAGPDANMGLPAIPLTEANQDYLAADDNWPDSPLWQAWYQWREELLTQWTATQLQVARDVFSDNPNWLGTMVSSPTFWFSPYTGLNAERIAALPEVDYLVAGYMNGRNIDVLLPAARKFDKHPGGMIELAIYGTPDGVDPAYIVRNFTNQLDRGAELMLVYPLSVFREDRKDSEEWHKLGMDYKAPQIQAWRQCVEILNQRGGVRKLEFNP